VTTVRPQRNRCDRSRPSSISVVVPAYNAVATLDEQLKALAAQQFEGHWEVLVVDNGSTDGTAELARRYAHCFRAFAVVDGGAERGHSAPRNAGAQAARGELLAYCDADDVVEPGWLLAMADAASQYDIIGGWLEVGALNDEATRSWHQPWPRDRLRSWLLPYAVSANLAIWAHVLRDLGGWSASYEAGAEDTELSWRAQVAGYQLGFAPNAVVHYRYRSGIWQTARQAYKIGVNCEQILRDFAFLRSSDSSASASGGALGRAAWLATRLLYLVGSRRQRGQWICLAAEYLGRLRGAVRYRLLNRTTSRPPAGSAAAAADQEGVGRGNERRYAERFAPYEGEGFTRCG
jgi:cellulose synthase/poly-beta-1,6-N-acetylglucosamine synthase-like glycosyltransferase